MLKAMSVTVTMLIMKRDTYHYMFWIVRMLGEKLFSVIYCYEITFFSYSTYRKLDEFFVHILISNILPLLFILS